MADIASLIVRVKGEGVAQTGAALKTLTTQADKTAKSNVSVGSTAQQAGYQLQDMIVQIQGGTSAFVAIGQQVPQFLGAFGPIGAITGTIVALGAAVGGVLYKSIGKTTISTEQLEAAQKNLKFALGENSSGAKVLSDNMLELAKSSELAARAKIAAAMADAQLQINAARQEAIKATSSVESFFSAFNQATVKDAAREIDNFRSKGGDTAQMLELLSDKTTAAYSNLGATSNLIGNISEKFGVTTSQALGLVDAFASLNDKNNAQGLQAAADYTSQLAQSTNYANPELNKMASALQTANQQMLEGRDAASALRDAVSNLGEAYKKSEADARLSASFQIEALRIQTLEGEKQISAIADLKKKQVDLDNALNEQEKATAKQYIDEIAQQEIQAITDKEDKKLAIKQAKSNLSFEHDKAMAEAYLAKLSQSNLNEMQLIDAQQQEKQAKLLEYKNAGLVSEQQYQDALTEIQTNAVLARSGLENARLDLESKNREDSRRAELAATAEMERQKQKQIDDGINAQRNMTANLKSALGEQSAIYKASAIATATIDTYKAATGAYAAMASIPYVGPVLGAVAAGAAIVAGLANVNAIRSAREQGGAMVGGSAYQMAERGKAEVIVPAGSSRARTAAQMRDIMGQNSGGTQAVTIINQTTGRVDNVQTEQRSDEQLLITISEYISDQFFDPDSKISKARRATA